MLREKGVMEVASTIEILPNAKTTKIAYSSPSHNTHFKNFQ